MKAHPIPALAQTPFDLLMPKTKDFYLHALDVLDAAAIPFAIGGAYALAYYAGIVRHTKDIDVFVRRKDAQRALAALEKAGYRTERTHPHWIAKAFSRDQEDFVDIIYGSGNGLTVVDDEWIANAVDGEVLGREVKVCPAEEIIWSKSFIQERDRFDGADIAHLLLARADHLDWDRLLRRFIGHEAILLSHLILFGYIYPGHRDEIPPHEIESLLTAARNAPVPDEKLCRGTMFSYQQYLVDINSWGYVDARLKPQGPMTAQEIEQWTKAEK
jgi:hypothetical protein